MARWTIEENLALVGEEDGKEGIRKNHKAEHAKVYPDYQYSHMGKSEFPLSRVSLLRPEVRIKKTAPCTICADSCRVYKSPVDAETKMMSKPGSHQQDRSMN